MRQLLQRLADGVQINPTNVKIPQGEVTSLTVQNGLQVIFGIAGGVAVLIIIVSGIRFITSQGDPAAVTRNRSAIIYAVVGLIVSALGYSIVTFVLENVR